MAHSLSKESDSWAIFNPENYYMLTFVHSWASSKKTNNLPMPFLFQWLHIHFPSHMHMHTLVKHHLFTFSLYSICHSQCRNGCYILMEKLWSWLIILSLKNGSDTFNTSMCFCLHDRSVILVHLRALWNPFASLSTAEHTYSVLSGVIG